MTIKYIGKDAFTASNRKHNTNVYLSLRTSCLQAGCPELEWQLKDDTKVLGIFSLRLLLACILAVRRGLETVAAALDTH